MLPRFTYIHLVQAFSIHSNALKRERYRGQFKGQLELLAEILGSHLLAQLKAL